MYQEDLQGSVNVSRGVNLTNHKSNHNQTDADNLINSNNTGLYTFYYIINWVGKNTRIVDRQRATTTYIKQLTES